MKLASFSLCFSLLLFHWVFFAYLPFMRKENTRNVFIIETCTSVVACIFVAGWSLLH